jgi:hypothetical protein
VQIDTHTLTALEPPAPRPRPLSATRSIRNRPYPPENTPHPKTLSATKSASSRSSSPNPCIFITASISNRHFLQPPRSYRSAEGRRSAMAGSSYPAATSRVPFTNLESPVTNLPAGAGHAILGFYAGPPTGPVLTRWGARLIVNMIIRIAPKPFAFSANSISNRQYPRSAVADLEGAGKLPIRTASTTSIARDYIRGEQARSLLLPSSNFYPRTSRSESLLLPTSNFHPRTSRTSEASAGAEASPRAPGALGSSRVEITAEPGEARE